MRIFSIILLLLLVQATKAQPSNPDVGTLDMSAMDWNSVVNKLLADSLKMPGIDVSGTVYISFVVGIDGMPYNFTVFRKLHPLADAEALRVMKMLKHKFSPTYQDGKPIEVLYCVPVKFTPR